MYMEETNLMMTPPKRRRKPRKYPIDGKYRVTIVMNMNKSRFESLLDKFLKKCKKEGFTVEGIYWA